MKDNWHLGSLIIGLFLGILFKNIPLGLLMGLALSSTSSGRKK